MPIVGAAGIATSAIDIGLQLNDQLVTQQAQQIQGIISSLTGRTATLPLDIQTSGIPVLENVEIALSAIKSFPGLNLGIQNFSIGSLVSVSDTLTSIKAISPTVGNALSTAFAVGLNPNSINPFALAIDKQFKLVSKLIPQHKELAKVMEAVAIPRSLFKDIAKFTGALTSLTTAVGTQSAAFGTIANNLIGLASGVGLNLTNFLDIGTGVSQFVEFQKAVTPFKSLAGASGESTASISGTVAEIQRMGVVTSKAPGEVAVLATEMKKLGFTADEITVSLEGVVRASEATGTPLVRTGEVIAATLNQFQLGAEDTGRVADVLSAVSANAATDLNQLGEALKFSGATAKAAGQPLEDTVVTLGLLQNAGAAASTAGTGLSAAIAGLQKAAAAAKTVAQLRDSDVGDISSIGDVSDLSSSSVTKGKALNALGLGKDDVLDATGNLRPLLEIIPTLKERIEELGQTTAGAEKIPVLLDSLFGVEGGRAVIALVGQTNEAIRDLKKSADFSEGFATDTAEKNLDSLAGSLTLIGGSLQTAAVQIGEIFAPAVKTLVDGSLAAINTFLAIPAPLKTIIALGGVLIPAISVLNTGFRLQARLVDTVAKAKKLYAIASSAEARANLVASVQSLKSAAANKVQAASEIVKNNAVAASTAASQLAGNTEAARVIQTKAQAIADKAQAVSTAISTKATATKAAVTKAVTQNAATQLAQTTAQTVAEKAQAAGTAIASGAVAAKTAVTNAALQTDAAKTASTVAQTVADKAQTISTTATSAATAAKTAVTQVATATDKKAAAQALVNEIIQKSQAAAIAGTSAATAVKTGATVAETGATAASTAATTADTLAEGQNTAVTLALAKVLALKTALSTAEGRATLLAAVQEKVAILSKTAHTTITGVLTGKIALSTVVTKIHAAANAKLGFVFKVLNKTMAINVDGYQKMAAAGRQAFIVAVALFVAFKQVVSIMESLALLPTLISVDLSALGGVLKAVVGVVVGAGAAFLAFSTIARIGLANITAAVSTFATTIQGKFILVTAALFAISEALKSFTAGLEDVAKLKEAREEIQGFSEDFRAAKEEIQAAPDTGALTQLVGDVGQAFGNLKSNFKEGGIFNALQGGITDTISGLTKLLPFMNQSADSTDRFGASMGFLTRAQVANQRRAIALSEVIEATNEPFKEGIQLLNEYGLSQFDSSDNTRLGAERIEEFNQAADQQIKNLSSTIEVLKNTKGANEEENRQIEANVKALEKQRRIIQTRVQQLKLNLEVGDLTADQQRELAVTLDELTDAFVVNTEATKKALSEKSLALKESVVAGKLSQEEANADLLKTEQKGLQERLKFLEENRAGLEALVGLEIGDAKKKNEQIKTIEQETAQVKERLLDIEIEKRKSAEFAGLASLKKANAEATKAIEDSQQERTLAIKEQIAAGTLSVEEAANQEAQLASDVTSERIAQKEQEIVDVEGLVKKGLLSETEAQELLKKANSELAALNIERIDKELEAREKATAATVAGIDQELNAKKSALKIESEFASLASKSLGNEQKLESAKSNLISSQLKLEEAQLQTKLKQAEATGDSAQQEQIKSQLLDLNDEKAKSELASKQTQLDLSVKQAEIENQRATISSEIAVLEAQAAIEKAKASGASDAELASLQRVLDLKREQQTFVAQDFAVQQEVFDIQQSQLDIEGQIQSEKQAQAILAEQVKDTEVETKEQLSQQKTERSELKSEAVSLKDLTELQEAAEERINQSLERRKQTAQFLQDVSQLQTEQLNNSASLISAQEQLGNNLFALENQRLEQAIKIAEEKGKEKDVEKLKAKQAKLAAQQAEFEFAVKERQLQISQEQTALELERAKIAAEIATIEAQVALDKAVASGADSAEIANLERIKDLREAQVSAVENNIKNQERLNALEKESLNTEKQIADEAARFAQGKKPKKARGRVSPELESLGATSATGEPSSISSVDGSINPAFKAAQAELSKPLGTDTAELAEIARQRAALEAQQASLQSQVSPQRPGQSAQAQRPSTAGVEGVGGDTQIVVQNQFNNRFTTGNEKQLAQNVQNQVIGQLADTVQDAL